MKTLTEAERNRLAALLGMLRSDQPGERDNAARLAEQFRKTAGFTWTELVSAPRLIVVPKKPAAEEPGAEPPKAEEPPPPPPEPPPVRPEAGPTKRQKAPPEIKPEGFDAWAEGIVERIKQTAATGVVAYFATGIAMVVIITVLMQVFPR